MIGVIADSADTSVVKEFFELFKTPWEFYRPEAHYDVVLNNGEHGCVLPDLRLVIDYYGRIRPAERAEGVAGVPPNSTGRVLRCPQGELVVYGDCVLFNDGDSNLLLDIGTQRPAVRVKQDRDKTVVRVGYDLFKEVRILLTSGQPIEQAGIPSLDQHIDLLRQLIAASGVRCAEVPPVPPGYRFIAVLTHDVDHPSIRLHRFDHTVAGFLFRAVIGSIRDVAQGRIGLGGLVRNWSAAIKWPLVHLGLVQDFWLDFIDYPVVEGGRASTFFIIPFEGQAGRRGNGSAPRRRSSSYGAAGIATQIQALRAQGCEIALHGIDAWCEESAARNELGEIRKYSGTDQIGVRMHWLYFDESTPARLERAGADYDSTVGYNGAVGYRAGTAQVYRPLGLDHLLELPLIVMDTALFYPDRLNLRYSDAWKLVSKILDHAERAGGCVTVNWHDRSISPERHWGGFYRDLVQEMARRGAWITTASCAVRWFRKRRKGTVGIAGSEPDPVRKSVEQQNEQSEKAEFHSRF